jgi:hypothetical protein
MEDHVVISLLFFGIIFCALWCGVMKITAAISGWSRLSEAYAAPQPFTGTLIRYQSLLFGYANYNSIIDVGVSPEALYLRLIPFLGFGHTPLLIPFSDLRATVRKGWFSTTCHISFTRFPEVSMRIFLKLAEKIKAASVGTFDYEDHRCL